MKEESDNKKDHFRRKKAVENMTPEDFKRLSELKEKHKQLLKDMMDDDAKSGLYDTL